ncbi:matrix metallopeptidase-21-like [Hoplias malabaricus]|uniref:matrix metallopeptidase-21-like n=1 Tax=Hoplias malabaricus TaxID=27720 RepID=UPI00346247D5
MGKMNVLLLKEPRESDTGPDPYIKLFHPEKYGGLIFTSPRAVEAVKMCIETSTCRKEWNTLKDKWNTKSVYVVGKATASLVEALGLKPCGEHTGTADVLSRLIIEREGPAVVPLLFPCGSLKREVLPTALRQNEIPLETLTVYQTVEHPDLEKNITQYFTEKGMPDSIAFFSPSGVKFCLDTLKKLAGPQLDQIKFAAIGPTTADALGAEGLRVSCSAEKPTPQHLAKGIAQSLRSDTGEKLFHRRDHSDVTPLSSHQAALITDFHSAQYGFIKTAKWEEPPNDAAASSEDFDSFLLEGESSGRSPESPFFLEQESSGSSSESPDFVEALREFQRVSGLPITGLFDDATKVAMNKPRCGVPDKEEDLNETTEYNSTSPELYNHTMTSNISNTDLVLIGTVSETQAQPKPATRRKRHLAVLVRKSRTKRESSEWGHMAFSKSVLRWRLIGEGYSSQLSIDDQRYIFRLAFRMWSEVSPLEFVEDLHSPLEEIDIRLGFGTGRHLGCAQRFDGAGREFAHAWFLGDIHFNDDEHFTAPNTGAGISLLKVAVHEIGHVLGLPHIYRAGSIMQPSYRPQDAGFELDWLDRKAIQNLYGGCKGRYSTVFDWVRKEKTQYGEVVMRFNTYFMRDGWYWLYENRNNRTRYGDPVAVQVGWHGIPSDGVDAYVHVWTRNIDAAYFFKGTQYWRYNSERDQVFSQETDGQRYPRLISEGFPGVPSPIDTAFYDRRDAQIYFFRGSMVYRFDVRGNRLAAGSPKKMTEVFPAIAAGDHPVSHLDAAYFSYTHNALFLLKGTSYWRVVGSRERRLRTWLPYNGLLPRREVDQHWFDICDVHSSSLKTARR